jgi:hypothetical protein
MSPVVLLAAIAAASAPVPPLLAVPASASLVLQAQGRGVQIYVCAAQPDQPGRYDWRFVAPQANLFGPDGARIGRHYAGPTWEGADGGKVVGEVRAKAASPDPSAIDWLLLSAKAANGTGVLGQVGYVQRVDTIGGRAPAAGCSGANAGEQTQVPYSAEYKFYTSR